MKVVLQGHHSGQQKHKPADNQIMLHSALPFWALALGGGGRLIYKSDWDRGPALCFDHLMGRRKENWVDALGPMSRVLLEIWEGVLVVGESSHRTPEVGSDLNSEERGKSPLPEGAHIPCMVLLRLGPTSTLSTKVCFFQLQRKSNPFYKNFLHNASPSSGSAYPSIFLSYYNVPGIILSILRVSF